MDEQIEQALDKMTPKQRDVVILRLVDNMTYEQIGIKLGISKMAAWYRYYSGVSKAKAK